ncbi:MAG: hypothetical protein LV481_14550 [Methylacidiphilales bacterium]|nr:hypothetical protein [Candidatus Methylacidiphilales bacterium]
MKVKQRFRAVQAFSWSALRFRFVTFAGAGRIFQKSQVLELKAFVAKFLLA